MLCGVEPTIHCHVHMQNPELAAKVIEAINGLKIRGVRQVVRYFNAGRNERFNLIKK